MRLSQYSTCVYYEDQAIIFNGCTGAVDVTEHETAERICNPQRAAQTEVLDQSLTEYLVSRGHLIEEHNKQKNAVLKLREFLHKRDTKVSGFFIIPTYSCQIRCHYCCQRSRWTSHPEDSDSVMPLSMVDDVFHAMRHLNVKGIRSLNLYGGEPLQAKNYKVIERIVRHSQNDGYMLSATTNGLEAQEFSDLAGPGKIAGVCFSVHGLPEGSDWQRFVMNIEAFLSNNAHVSIRLNVDKDTITQITMIFQKIREYPWHDHPLLSWNICPILPSGPDLDFDVLQPEQYVMSITSLLSENHLPEGVEFDLSAGRQLISMLEKGYPSPVHPRHPSFCGSHQGTIVFDPYGDIYSCHEAVRDSRFIIGSLSKAAHADDIANIEQSHWSPDQDEACSDCAYVLICGGGCVHRNCSNNADVKSLLCRWVEASVKLALLGLSGAIPYRKHTGWM